ncbi:PAS domain-containing sensor histidine kinase [Desulfosoma caldarium]|uniref:histidine kinase n=1 Tax=Desulfosoma caldarium TaxID=610254 RepID=A0A3N1UM69_9BACT|nr:PAS domain-containing sensor histidine kinase [Desulfosoma caldarium]ROQ92302.1 two-component system sensor histidine kinase HydH [Desulfosoma caldarium]
MKPAKRSVVTMDSPWLSPWLILGAAGVLAVILAVVALRNADRERRFMETILSAQAHTFQVSLEAGTRTGMMGRMGWGRNQLQMLMEQTAQEPSVLYLRLVDRSGRVIASSNSQEMGQTLPPSLEADRAGHAYTDFQGKKAFEVVRPYEPWARCGTKPRTPCVENGQDRGQGLAPPRRTRWPNPFFDAGPLRFVVGLNATPVQDAMRQDMVQNALLLAILFVLGATGFVALFWAQGYRLARKSLRTMEVMTEAIFSRMPVGLVATDRQGVIRRTNPAAASLLGPHVEAGRSLRDIPALESLRQRLEKGEDPIEDNLRYEMGQNTPKPLLINATVIQDAENNPAGFAFLLSDMTAVRTLEEKLRRHERLAALGKLASGVAHEIRNPLSSIKGFAAILARKAAGDPSAQEVAQTMTHEVDRLNRVISELLEFARPAELEIRPVQLRDIIEHSMKLVERDALQAGVELSVELSPPDLRAEVDADRFSQVLLNLYLNAIQAMHRGGRLSVRASMDQNTLRVDVEDTGPGIAPEALGHVFDPYFTTKPNGVGLGLAIVHKIVEAHGGDIVVDKSDAKGTRFVIRIPQNASSLSHARQKEMSLNRPVNHEGQGGAAFISERGDDHS